MILEPIFVRKLEHPEQIAVQTRAIAAVRHEPEHFFINYVKHPDSFMGRYICTDLFKELFPDFNKSKESRGLFNIAVHNSAAVLASEQFRRGEFSLIDIQVDIFLLSSPNQEVISWQYVRNAKMKRL